MKHSRIYQTTNRDRQKSGEDNQQDGDEMDEDILPPMPPPGEMPTYFHVGSLAKECLLSGFKLDAWQLRSIAETNKKLFLCSFGQCSPDLTNPFGGFEVYQELGNVHITLDWLTNKKWAADVGVFGELFGGLAVSTLKTDTFQQKGNELKSNLIAAYERSSAKMEVIMPIYNEPLVKGYLLLAPAKDWLLGYRTEYNLEEKGFDKHALCVGYSDGTTEVGLKMENLKDLRGSLFQRLGDSWALALKTNLYGDEALGNIAIGGQYDFMNGTLLKARIKDDFKVGIVCQTKIVENIEMQYHVGFDGKDPINGQHKIGAAWSFNC